MRMADADGSKTLDRGEVGDWLRHQETAGGPAVSAFAPKLIARLKEEGPPRDM